jgi:hypothetical protein
VGFNKIKHLHLPDELSGEKQVLEKFRNYKNLLFPLNSCSQKSHLKNGWLQGEILSVYQMCKLLLGLVFLVILALELFFNRLRNGWLHTVRVVLRY